MYQDIGLGGIDNLANAPQRNPGQKRYIRLSIKQDTLKKHIRR